MNPTLYKSLKPIILYSGWHLIRDSYKEDRISIEFTLCFKLLKIEIILNKENLTEDIKKMMKSIKERNL